MLSGITTSMMRDIVTGRPSEIRDLIGRAVQLGKQRNVNMPLSTFIYYSLLPQEMKARGEISY